MTDRSRIGRRFKNRLIRKRRERLFSCASRVYSDEWQGSFSVGRYWVAKIFYSMAGEGRGHAVRVLTLVEQLRREHELVLFASDDAYEFLLKTYGHERVENVRLVRVKGVKFRYTGGKLDLFKSTAGAIKFAYRQLPSLVDALRRQIDTEQPDLAISDFEPTLPRAARLSGLPWMSIDHQHVLLAYDLSSLPFLLRRYAWWMSWSIRWYYGWSGYTPVASSFYSPPLKVRLRGCPASRSDAACRGGLDLPEHRRFFALVSAQKHAASSDGSTDEVWLARPDLWTR